MPSQWMKMIGNNHRYRWLDDNRIDTIEVELDTGETYEAKYYNGLLDGEYVSGWECNGIRVDLKTPDFWRALCMAGRQLPDGLI